MLYGLNKKWRDWHAKSQKDANDKQNVNKMETKMNNAQTVNWTQSKMHI